MNYCTCYLEIDRPKFIKFQDVYGKIRYVREDLIQSIEEFKFHNISDREIRTKVTFGGTYTDCIYLKEEVDEVIKLIRR